MIHDVIVIGLAEETKLFIPPGYNLVVETHEEAVAKCRGRRVVPRSRNAGLIIKDMWGSRRGVTIRTTDDYVYLMLDWSSEDFLVAEYFDAEDWLSLPDCRPDRGDFGKIGIHYQYEDPDWVDSLISRVRRWLNPFRHLDGWAFDAEFEKFGNRRGQRRFRRSMTWASEVSLGYFSSALGWGVLPGVDRVVSC